MALGVLRAPASAPRPALAAREHDPLTMRLSDEGDTGEVVYLRYCSGCHGVAGDGKGPAAPFLSPKPRNFTSGVYKFTTTPSGSPPLEEDLLRTVTEGLHGTSMPGWRFLPLGERRSAVKHVLAFHKEWELRTAEPPVPFHENPVSLESREAIEAAIARGRDVYHKKATCWSCHPGYMPVPDLEKLLGGPARSDIEKPLPKPDLWEEVILPPDFRTATLKSVKGLQDLYRAVTAGVGGTAMPTWKGALSADELWSLAFYVDSLRPPPYSVVNRTLVALAEAEGK